MELKIVDLNDNTIELMELMSKGLLTAKAVEIISNALMNKEIKATYKTPKTEDYMDGTGAIRTRYLKEFKEVSFIDCLACNFHSTMIKQGEEHGLMYLLDIIKHDNGIIDVGQKIEVIKGRKYPKGTTGIVTKRIEYRKNNVYVTDYIFTDNGMKIDIKNVKAV